MNDSIKFNCTKCGQSIEVASDKAGVPVMCPACSFFSTPPAKAVTQTSQPKSNGRLLSRYTDAYVAAHTITAIGAIVKIIAFVLGGGVILIGLITNYQSTQFIIGSIVLGAVVGIPIYVLGIIVSAQGQILKATLDTAVNTSPLLNMDEMQQIMSLD